MGRVQCRARGVEKSRPGVRKPGMFRHPAPGSLPDSLKLNQPLLGATAQDGGAPGAKQIEQVGYGDARQVCLL
jgi:hypothetical protein